jgi:hypothetical protein
VDYFVECGSASLPVGLDPGLNRFGVDTAQVEPRAFRQQPAMQARQVPVPLEQGRTVLLHTRFKTAPGCAIGTGAGRAADRISVT